MSAAYPLQWPVGMPRTASPARSAFGAKGIGAASTFVLNEIRRMRGSLVVISSNLQLRGDGLPYANQRQPNDCGVAVYFQRRGQPIVFACDRWHKIEHNLHAIGKTIEALRGIERWGSADMVDQAFSGFAALPAPALAPTGESWWQVLEVREDADMAMIEAQYRILSRLAHPDAGGSNKAMARLNAAREAARRARG